MIRFVMVIIVGAILVLLSSLAVFAAVPQLINYQGVLTDSTGATVPDAAYMVKFIIWDDPTATGAGNEKWNSNFQTVNTVDGLFEYTLGSNVNLPDNLFSDTTRWLGITVGTDPEINPRARLVSTGYACHALRADTAGVSASVLVNSIGSAEVIDNSLTSADLGTNSVTADEIATGAVGVLEIGGNAVGGSELINESIFNEKIAPGAAIDVTKISGTAVNLSSTQTITGEKQFGDSTMKINSTGITIGTNSFSPSSDYLVYANRTYNSASTKYGHYTSLQNINTGSMYGYQVDLQNINPSQTAMFGVTVNVGSTSDGGGYRTGIYSVVNSGHSSGVLQYAGRFFAGDELKTLGLSVGVQAIAYGGTGSSAYGIFAVKQGTGFGYAGYFSGNVQVVGNLSKSSGSFKIDHPLDPANKYLVHSFVESPDMMNVYNGNVTTDGNGDAVISLPEYFDALNKDFRYQLTVIGQFAQVIVSQKISGNQFSIRTDIPNVEVFWQVTGVRKDAYAEAHRIKVEPDKPIAEKGLYLHPVELGLSETKQLHYEMHKNAELERERVDSKSTQELDSQ